MLNNNEIRHYIQCCINHLCLNIPILKKQYNRFFALLERCSIQIIDRSISPDNFAVFSLPENPVMHAKLLCVSQLADIRPYPHAGKLHFPPPFLLLRQDITHSGLLHEISHLLSTGLYLAAGNQYTHKRGILREAFHLDNHRLRLLSSEGDTETNECLTDLCAEWLFTRIFSGETFLRNDRFRRFLHNHPEIDVCHAITEYLSDDITNSTQCI